MNLLESPLLLGRTLPSQENIVLKSNGEIDIAAMVEELEKHLKEHFWKVA